MARGSRGLCPLGLWPHQVSLLSWGSAGWTPPSRMPSYPWDYIQLARPPLRTGACPPPRAPDWEPPGDLQASPLPGCPPYSCIWRLLLWLPLRSPARLTAPPNPWLCLPDRTCVPFPMPPSLGSGPSASQPSDCLPNTLVFLTEPTPVVTCVLPRPPPTCVPFPCLPQCKEAFPLRVTQVSRGSPVPGAQAPPTPAGHPPPSILGYLFLWAWPPRL